MHIYCLQTTADAQLTQDIDSIMVQHYPIIGSSSRICWQVTRVDTGQRKPRLRQWKYYIYYIKNITIYYSLMTWIICHVYDSEYT